MENRRFAERRRQNRIQKLAADLSVELEASVISAKRPNWIENNALALLKALTLKSAI